MRMAVTLIDPRQWYNLLLLPRTQGTQFPMVHVIHLAHPVYSVA